MGDGCFKRTVWAWLGQALRALVWSVAAYGTLTAVPAAADWPVGQKRMMNFAGHRNRSHIGMASPDHELHDYFAPNFVWDLHVFEDLDEYHVMADLMRQTNPHIVIGQYFHSAVVCAAEQDAVPSVYLHLEDVDPDWLLRQADGSPYYWINSDRIYLDMRQQEVRQAVISAALNRALTLGADALCFDNCYWGQIVGPTFPVGWEEWTAAYMSFYAEASEAAHGNGLLLVVNIAHRAGDMANVFWHVGPYVDGILSEMAFHPIVQANAALLRSELGAYERFIKAGKLVLVVPYNADDEDYGLRLIRPLARQYGNIYLATATPVHENPLFRLDLVGPEIAPLEAQTVPEGSQLSFSVNATDPDGLPFTLLAEGLPEGAQFAEALLSWEPGYEQAGLYQVDFMVTDGYVSATETVQIEVVNTNRPPSLAALEDQSVAEAMEVSITLTGTDPDGDNVSYAMSGSPAGAQLEGNLFCWTPDYNQAGVYEITFTATDAQAEATQNVVITVQNVNRSPLLGPPADQNIGEGAVLDVALGAVDPDGDLLTYTGENLPVGAMLEGDRFWWQPSYDAAGVYDVMFTVTDGAETVSTDMTITVVDVDRAPEFRAVPSQAMTAGEAVSFIVEAIDPDGGPVSCDLVRGPVGSLFAGGLFSWQSSSEQAGYYTTVFEASDGATSSLMSVAIRVAALDVTAPTVTRTAPAPGAIQVPPNTLIMVDLSDTGTGIDPNTVTIHLEDQLVYAGYAPEYDSASGRCQRQGNPTNYRYFYQPTAVFSYGQTVDVRINALDEQGNRMTECRYSFATEMQAFGAVMEAESTLPIGTRGRVVTVAAEQIVWAVYEVGPAPRRDLYISRIRAQAEPQVDTTLPLVVQAADQCNPDAALGPDGSLYVTWQDNRAGHWDIYAARSQNGLSFTEARLTDSPADQTHPRIGVDTAGSVYVVYEDQQEQYGNIYLSRLTAALDQQEQLCLSASTAHQVEPALALTNDGRFCAVWADARNGGWDLYGASGVWGQFAEVALVSEPGDQRCPVVVLDEAGTMHMVWVSQQSGQSDIYYASGAADFSTAPFQGRNLVDDDCGAQQSEPALAVSPADGRVFASWRDDRNVSGPDEDSDVYFVQVNGDCATNVLVSSDTAAEQWPALGVDGQADPYVLWVRGPAGRQRLMFTGGTNVGLYTLASEQIVASTGGRVSNVATDPAAPGDVCVELPAEALWSDLELRIHKVKNVATLAGGSLVLGAYEFAPSSPLEFAAPVTITIAYDRAVPVESVYWYDPQTGFPSQEGLSHVEQIVLSPTVGAVRFQTTHFTRYLLAEAAAPPQTSASGGGCHLTPKGGQGDIVGFALPYLLLLVGWLSWKRRRKRQSSV